MRGQEQSQHCVTRVGDKCAACFLCSKTDTGKKPNESELCVVKQDWCFATWARKTISGRQTTDEITKTKIKFTNFGCKFKFDDQNIQLIGAAIGVLPQGRGRIEGAGKAQERGKRIMQKATMRHSDLAGKLKKRDAFHNRRNATQSSFGWLAAATKRDKCYQSNDEKKVRVHIELGRNEIACAVSAIAPLMLGACLAAPLGVLLASI